MCRLGAMGAGHFPVLLSIVMVITLGSTYCMAVYWSDVDPFFPYISATGTKRPESCIFGELLFVAALLTLIIVYLRYRLVKELNRGADEMLRRLNIVSAFFGLASTIGLTIVANFQETAVMSIHLVGAFMCFGFGTLYAIVHAVITYRMCPLYNGVRIARIRAVAAVVCLLAFLSGITTASVASRDYRRAYGHDPPHLWFKHGQAGWSWHVASAVSEWVLAMAFGAFLLSFSRDFEKIRLAVAVEPLVQHLDEVPVLVHSDSSSRIRNTASPLPV